jgi:DNA invertase Pin-like site-specific DNA recombinase
LDERLILDLYQNGLPGDPNGSSTNKIAAYLGCHKSLVSRIVKKYGLLRYRRMTRDQQRAMVHLYQDGLSAPEIAKRFKVCSPAVYLALQKQDIERRSVSDYNYEEPTIRHDFFDQIDEPQKAYWLGMLVTDGCVFGSGPG